MSFEGRQRVIIENVKPEIEGGTYPIKRIIGEKVVVEADVFTDRHDSLSASILYKRQQDSTIVYPFNRQRSPR